MSCIENQIPLISTYKFSVFGIAVLILIATVVIYRRYFSPLSDIPGPFWASFSRLWHIRITLQGNQNERLSQAHQKYGHFVRLANNEISVSHPDAVNKVLMAPLEKVIVPITSKVLPNR